MNNKETGDQRLRAWLLRLHGKDQGRLYLTTDEARTLTRQHAPGVRVFYDLDTLGYSGKQRQAIELQIRQGRDPHTWEFWHGARLAFLELGGGYRPASAPPVPNVCYAA